ncbi:MAG: hypothetical protein AAFV86_09850 [Pseudomonadota bacterium]
MKSAITRLVLVALPSLALALPAEDHWSADTDPADAARLEESRLLIEAERYEDALAILEGLAKAMPASADVFNLLGFAHRKTGNLAVSGAHYERALYLKPDHLGALEYQGELFLLLGDIAGARANLRRLEALCDLPCEEREELDEAIRAWQAQ